MQQRLLLWFHSCLTLLAVLSLSARTPSAAADAPPTGLSGTAPELLVQLRSSPFKIVYETIRDGNWELYMMRADGTDPINLTRTPDVDELYAKASPDGSRIVFVADEGKGEAKRRNLYWMRRDGSGRTLVCENAREPCWNADGTAIAFLKCEKPNLDYWDYATKGIFIHDLKSRETRQHPNAAILHLYTLNWTPDGKWFLATVHGGMGFSHAILALEGAGNGVFDLHLGGCRPDLSPDSKKVAWGHGDFAVGVGDLHLETSPPKVTNVHNVVESADPLETYHADWSPDGRYICYSFGPKKTEKDLKGLLPEFPGVTAPGWNICVADAEGHDRWVALTTDGKSCKEPDWVPPEKEAGAR